MTTLLRVEGLRKVFRVRGASGATEGLVAVDDLTFSLEHGGSLAVVGESGSGKTTVARIVAGLESATAGTVTVAGRLRPPMPWSRDQRRVLSRQVQMVFQDPYSSLDPYQTVESTLSEMLRQHSEGDPQSRRARVVELIEQVGLDTRHLSRRPRGLSGGERQRVAIARALAAEPDLLILDESVSALDVSVQAHVLNLLTDLRRELGIAYLFISHDLAVVRQISDECIVMRGGVVEEGGATNEVLANPRADYTRQLIEAIPGPGWKPRRRISDQATAHGVT